MSNKCENDLYNENHDLTVEMVLVEIALTCSLTIC